MYVHYIQLYSKALNYSKNGERVYTLYRVYVHFLYGGSVTPIYIYI